jgi:hypothetical protein
MTPPRLRNSFCLLLFTGAAACASSTGPSNETGSGANDVIACTEGTKVPFPQFRLLSQTYFVEPTSKNVAPFQQENETVIVLDGLVEHAFTVVALGGGPGITNTKSIDPEDFSLCGQTVRIAPRAHVVFWGDSVPEQLEGTYCVPGTLDTSRETPRCELKGGIPLEARTFPEEGVCSEGVFLIGSGNTFPPIAGGDGVHTVAGHTFKVGIPVDVGAHSVTVRAVSGDGGQSLELDRRFWDACGDTIIVQRKARAKLEGCGDAVLCGSLVDTFCNPGTFSQHTCEVKNGIRIEAALVDLK